jgi:hypothetical protein
MPLPARREDERGAVFASLDDVDWMGLGDAYGPADCIPWLLRGLIDRDPSTRREALDQLSMGLCNQRASLAEASTAAVPFLVELALSPRVRDRAAILELLRSIAAVAHRPSDAAENTAHAAIRAATRRALARDALAIRQLLGDDDADVRAGASLLAAQLAHDGDDQRALAATLTQRLRAEEVASARVGYVEALHRLGALEALRVALSDPELEVRLAAALASLRRDEPAPASLDVVRAALASGVRRRDLVQRVCAAGSAAARALLPELLGVLAASSSYAAEADLAPLVATFFPRGLEARPTREQSALAATIAQHRGYFGQNANADAVLHRHGLPARPALLRAHARLGPADHAAIVPPLASLPPADALLPKLLGGVPPGDVESLFLVGVASDSLLTRLPDLSGLRHLAIKTGTATASGLSALARLPLRELWLEDLALDVAGVRTLVALQSLSALTLVDVTLGDGALAALRNAPVTLTLTVGGRPVC